MYSEYEMVFRFFGVLGAGILAFQAGFGAEIQKSPSNPDVLSPEDLSLRTDHFEKAADPGPAGVSKI